ncbi:MAG: vWA domain-containing protein [Crocosphaera sp.]
MNNKMWIRTYSKFILGLILFFAVFCVIFIVNPKISPKEIFHSNDNWIFMVDTSGSMIGKTGRSREVNIEGKNIFDEAKNELINIINKYLEVGSSYELYTFNEKTTLVAQGSINKEEELKDLVPKVQNISNPVGYETTCLSNSLKLGEMRAKELSQANNLPTRLLLVTDGFDSPDDSKNCLFIPQGVNLGVTYILNKEYLRLFPSGYNINPSNNPLLRHCFLDYKSSKLTKLRLIRNTILTLIPLIVLCHFFFLYFVQVSINDRNNSNIIGGAFIWLFFQLADVREARSDYTRLQGKSWKYGIVILMHSVPASFIAYYIFCYLWLPLLLINGIVLILTILSRILRT